MTITVIVGLQGSGKSHYGNSLNLPFIDDYNKNFINYDLETFKGIDFVIADPLLCGANPEMTINKLYDTFGKCDIKLVLFKNEPELCIQNVKNRNDGRVISNTFIYHLSNKYDIEQWTQLGLSYIIKGCYGNDY